MQPPVTADPHAGHRMEGAAAATDVPLAWKAITDPIMRVGINKAIAKTAVQALVYPTVLLWIGVRAWRHSAAPPKRRS